MHLLCQIGPTFLIARSVCATYVCADLSELREKVQPAVGTDGLIPPKSEASPVASGMRVRRLSKTKGDDGRLWAEVETEDGQTGFVPAKALRMSK